MMMKTFDLKIITVTFLLIPALSIAQKKVDNAKVEQTYAKYLGRTPELRNLTSVPNADEEKAKKRKANNRPSNFRNRKINEVKRPDLEHHGPDPLRQGKIAGKSAGKYEIKVNTDGLTMGFSPNDPSGDKGKNHYVQAINATEIGVYNNDGSLQTSFTASTIWSSIGYSSAGDPIVLYDQEYDRWIITEFPSSNHILIAISNTSDPLGTWDAYDFSTPSFPDYPKYGIWGNSIVITTNEDPGQLSCYVINRQDLINTVANVRIQRILVPGSDNTEVGFYVATPVDWSGKTPPPADSDPMVMRLNDSSWGDVSQDQVEIYSFDIDWNNSSNTTVTNTSIVTTSFDSNPCAAEGVGFSCAPQPSITGEGLDALPEFIMNQPDYRNFGSYEGLVFNFITDVDGNDLAGIRWVELRRTTGQNWSMYQEGTFSPNDDLHRYMGGISYDASGNIALAYNVSSDTEYAGIRFTGRMAGDPLGEMTIPEVNVVSGLSSLFNGGRFGDYSHMSIDNDDEKTFWFTSEYAGVNERTNTRIVAFTFRSDTFDIRPVALITPQSADNLTNAETVTVQVSNTGLQSVSSFTVGYIFNGQTETEPVAITLAPGETYDHTFTSTADLSAIGPHNFTLFTSMSNDQFVFNDTVEVEVVNFPMYDVGVTQISGIESSFCTPSNEVFIRIENGGTASLTSATVTIDVNGDDTIIQWTGSLAQGEYEDISFLLTGVQGTNSISVTAADPNGMNDQYSGNNVLTDSFDMLGNSGTMTLSILTDDFPDETFWSLSDDSGTQLQNGGPYLGENTIYKFEFCVDTTACFEFVFNDSWGDGVDGGNYTFSNGAGVQIAEMITPDFGYVEVNSFCYSQIVNCNSLSFDTQVSDESNSGANDGAILVSLVTNGQSPFEYSFDGGMTYQNNYLMNNLASGDYSVVVKDANGCTDVQLITVDLLNGIPETNQNYEITVAPNPTQGIFSIAIEGLSHDDIYVHLDIYDLQGKKILQTKLPKYNDTFKGPVSLYSYPSGIYYIRFTDRKDIKMMKLVKL